MRTICKKLRKALGLPPSQIQRPDFSKLAAKHEAELRTIRAQEASIDRGLAIMYQMISNYRSGVNFLGAQR